MTPTVLHMIDELKSGGAQTHLVTVLRHWVPTSRYRHVVLSLFNDGPPGQELRKAGVDVRVLNLSPLIRSKSFVRARDEIFKVIEEYKPALVESHLTYSRLLGLWAARRAQVPRTIGYEHGDIYLTSLPWRLANFVGQHCADQIVVCSHSLGEWMRKTHGISKKRLTVLHNCVDPQRFKVSTMPKIDRTTLGIPTEDFVFCAIGTLGSGVNKRMDIIISALSQALKENTKLYLLICGDGPLRSQLESLARSLKIEDRLQILGMRNDVPDVLHFSDAFVHSAPYEPFGIVCLEAMLMQKPVIIPDSGGIREIITEGVEGLKYPSLHSSALARKMLDLSRNKSLARTLGIAGHKKILESFTIEQYQKKLEVLYQIESVRQ